jgi:WD40 repeat protein
MTTRLSPWRLSPAEDRVAVAGQDGDLWTDGLDGKSRNLLAKLPAAARCMAFSTSGRLLAIGLSNGSADVYDLDRRGRVTTLRGHADAINAIAFSPDDRTLATGGAEGDVRLWDPMVGAERLVLKGSHGVQVLCFALDSLSLAAGGVDGEVRVWRSDYFGDAPAAGR